MSGRCFALENLRPDRDPDHLLTILRRLATEVFSLREFATTGRHLAIFSALAETLSCCCAWILGEVHASEFKEVAVYALHPRF
jgi:hypothetical protein